MGFGDARGKRETYLGVNFDKATLIREALDLLIEKYREVQCSNGKTAR